MLKEKIQNIEILSPGGDVDSVKAAILGGANSVYLGLKKFNARKRAENIDNQQLAELVRIAHQNKVKIFVTMNILLTQKEIPVAIEVAHELINLSIDALIVQDAGLCYLLKKNFPNLEIHASTQMTTHNSLQVEFLSKLGIKQLNFSRELSADEIKPLIKCSHEHSLKTEIFVHGAYCISCSGICYMSATIAAQPGNRGACLQPCRRQYSTDENSEKEYFLSLKDNNALPHSEELIEMGADTFKIEGRIKGYNYVYEVTNTWRNTIDSIWGSKSNADQTRVNKVFNRDFSTGYFLGSISDKMFVNSPLDQSLKHVGIVENYTAKSKQLFIDRKSNLDKGERINIYTPQNKFICGAVVTEIKNSKQYVIEIEGQLKGRILKGQLVLSLANKADSLKDKIDKLKPLPDILNVSVKGKVNEPLTAIFKFNGKESIVKSESLLTLAENVGLSKDTINNQFGRLGNTTFKLGGINTDDLEDGLFIPIKELNNMRREAVDSFTVVPSNFKFIEKEVSPKVKNKKLAVLVSDVNDLELEKEISDGQVFLEVTTYNRINELSKGTNIWLPPFIVDRDIEHYKNLISEIEPGIVISENSGLGNLCGNVGQKWVSGPQLNSSNGYTFDTYSELSKASGGFYSTEINKNQIKDFSIPENFNTYYTVFGPVLLMTTRQCLFLKPGLCPHSKSQTDIGCIKGCDNYTKYFDERNIPFHIVKGYGHINRIFNNALLFLPEAVNEINADYYLLDLRDFRFTNYSREQKINTINFFKSVIDTGRIDKEQSGLIKEFVGSITRGNYQRGFE